ncbi:cobaltochelatase subunit CobN [Desulfofundulus sp. TPOSR]|uniref:cobaltochelatase subunit CobN n=1 Tax=Desulfofundulus sp. TPOSR TaxID=2714340 RepID=UPI0028BDE246|nr:cobaltochelatase subunit CobN [Desulfofundulus sp. TPOSR]
MQKLLGKQNEEICRVIEYTVNTLVPVLAATKQELDNCLNSLAGGFVPPGPSGAPTRGMADILPTGRNFYSVDPQAVPSRAAWQVGRSLADALLERYRQAVPSCVRPVQSSSAW